MKNAISLFLSLLFVGANAQIINSADAIVATDRIKVLYVGLDNPISIAVPGIKSKKIMATCEGCSLTQTSSGHYLATVDPNVSEATIHTFVDGKEIGNTKFLVAKLPKPFAQLGTIPGASAKASEIANQNIVVCALGSDIPYVGLKYTVTKYSLVLSPKDTSMPAKFFTGIRGNMIPPDIKTALSTLMPSDMISIFGIEAMGPDKLGLVKLSSSLVITIE